MRSPVSSAPTGPMNRARPPSARRRPRPCSPHFHRDAVRPSPPTSAPRMPARSARTTTSSRRSPTAHTSGSGSVVGVTASLPRFLYCPQPVPLTVIDHPLVADRVLTLPRRTHEVGRLPAHRTGDRELPRLRGTRDLPTEEDEVTTPLGLVARGCGPSMPGPLVVPILRAGLGLLDGVLGRVARRRGRCHRPQARRDHASSARVSRTPSRRSRRPARVHRRPHARDGRFVGHGVRDVAGPGRGPITALCLIAAPEGVEPRACDRSDRCAYSPPRSIRQLNEHAFIVPGLGDAGDRLYGAGSA